MLHIAAAETKRQQVLPAKISTKAQILVSFDTCEIKYLCGGDCYYNSYMKTGSQFEPDPEFCRIQKHLIQLAIMLRYKIEKIDIRLYNTILAEVKRKHDYSEIYG